MGVPGRPVRQRRRPGVSRPLRPTLRLARLRRPTGPPTLGRRLVLAVTGVVGVVPLDPEGGRTGVDGREWTRGRARGRGAVGVIHRHKRLPPLRNEKVPTLEPLT